MVVAGSRAWPGGLADRVPAVAARGAIRSGRGALCLASTGEPRQMDPARRHAPPRDLRDAHARQSGGTSRTPARLLRAYLAREFLPAPRPRVDRARSYET